MKYLGLLAIIILNLARIGFAQKLCIVDALGKVEMQLQQGDEIEFTTTLRDSYKFDEDIVDYLEPFYISISGIIDSFTESTLYISSVCYYEIGDTHYVQYLYHATPTQTHHAVPIDDIYIVYKDYDSRMNGWGWSALGTLTALASPFTSIDYGQRRFNFRRFFITLGIVAIEMVIGGLSVRAANKKIYPLDRNRSYPVARQRFKQFNLVVK